jgi:DNA (cytosine-5)-methyltransferase 1
MDKAIQRHSFFSIIEVAKELGISQKTVRRHIASGKLKSVKIGGVFRIPIDALEDFINSKVVEPDQNCNFNSFGKKIIPNDKASKSIKKINYKSNGADNVNWVSVTDVWKEVKPSDRTFVDLFSGAGGITKGFEMAGLRGVCGLDWFPEA